MDIFSIDLTLNELSVIRQALELVTIGGKDAKFLASLQIKIEQEIIEAQQLLQQEETKKKKELEQIVAADSKPGKVK
jgi:hypothetical protein